MTRPSLGLIGCGAAAERYYVPILRKHPGLCRDLYLVDRNINQANKLRGQIGTASLAQDHREILGKVQGAIICVPHHMHYAISMDFLRAGCHVLCEKPLAESGREARELVFEAEKNGVTIAVNNTRRMFPSSQKVKEMVWSGQIGQLRSIRYFEAMAFGWESATGFYVNPRISSKGVLLDVGPHILDLICWWLQGRPKVISYQDDSFGGPESVAHLTARHAGCEIDVTINRLYDLPSGYKLEGDTGSLEGEVYGWNYLTFRAKSGVVRKIKLKAEQKLYADFVKPIFLNFLDVIANGATPLIPGAAVLPSIEWIEACYQIRSRFDLPWYQSLEAALE